MHCHWQPACAAISNDSNRVGHLQFIRSHICILRTDAWVKCGVDWYWHIVNNGKVGTLHCQEYERLFPTANNLLFRNKHIPSEQQLNNHDWACVHLSRQSSGTPKCNQMPFVTKATELVNAGRSFFCCHLVSVAGQHHHKELRTFGVATWVEVFPAHRKSQVGQSHFLPIVALSH